MARISIAGLGDAPDCGTDPCTWWDNVWVRDACLTYLGCANPADIRYIGAKQGAGAAAGAAVGQEFGGAISGAAKGFASGVGGGAGGSTGLAGTMLIVGAAMVGALMLVFAFSRR